MISQIVAGLKHRSDKVRLKTAQQLRQYVTTELREMSAEDANAFTEELNKNVFVLISSSSEVHEKKGGVLAICKRPLISGTTLGGIIVGYFFLRTSFRSLQWR